MWRHIDENEKYEIAKHKSKNNPAVSKEGLLLCFLIFIVCCFVGLNDILPGEYSTEPYPMWNIVVEHFISILPICLGISVLAFLGLFLWYRFMNGKKRIESEYSNTFSSKLRICIKCNATYENEINICAKCKNETSDINDYIWEEEKK
jgi:hypothetical protein